MKVVAPLLGSLQTESYRIVGTTDHFLQTPASTHRVYVHTPLAGISGFNPSPPYYIVCFPLRRKCSQCQLNQSPPPLSLSVSLMLTRRGNSLQSAHTLPGSELHPNKGSNVPPSFYSSICSSQFLTQHIFLNVTQIMVGYN